MKRILTVCVLVLFAALFTALPVQARPDWAWEPSWFATWQEAYEHHIVSIDDRTWWFYLHDIDFDGVPELISQSRVVTFRNGNLITLDGSFRFGGQNFAMPRDGTEGILHRWYSYYDRVYYTFWVIQGNSIVELETVEYVDELQRIAGHDWVTTRGVDIRRVLRPFFTSNINAVREAFNNWRSPAGIAPPPPAVPPAHPFFDRSFGSWQGAYEAVIRAVAGAGFSLLDIDIDGVPELFLYYKAFGDWMAFTFADSQVQQIIDLTLEREFLGFYVPSGFRPGIIHSSFIHREVGGLHQFMQIENGLLTVIETGIVGPSGGYYIGDERVSLEEFYLVFDGTPLYQHSSNLTQVQNIFSLWQPQAFMGQPVPTRVSLGDSQTAISAFNIGGSAFARLRDLAAALSGTAQEFDITYDSVSSTISLMSGRSSPGEITPPSGEPAVAIPSPSAVLLDGTSLDMPSYRINGSVYVALRPFSEAFGMDIQWDSATDTVTVSPLPDGSYEEIVPAADSYEEETADGDSHEKEAPVRSLFGRNTPRDHDDAEPNFMSAQANNEPNFPAALIIAIIAAAVMIAGAIVFAAVSRKRR